MSYSSPGIALKKLSAVGVQVILYFLPSFFIILFISVQIHDVVFKCSDKCCLYVFRYMLLFSEARLHIILLIYYLFRVTPSSRPDLSYDNYYFITLYLDPCRLPVQTVHIETSEFPRYFAIVSRFTRQVETVIPDGALASLPNGVKIAFPQESCWKATNIKLQVDQVRTLDCRWWY